MIYTLLSGIYKGVNYGPSNSKCSSNTKSKWPIKVLKASQQKLSLWGACIELALFTCNLILFESGTESVEWCEIAAHSEAKTIATGAIFDWGFVSGESFQWCGNPEQKTAAV